MSRISIGGITPQERALKGKELEVATTKLVAFVPRGIGYLEKLAAPAEDYLDWLDGKSTSRKYERWHFVLAKEATIELLSKVLPKVEMRFGDTQTGGQPDAEELAYQLQWLTTTSAGIATAKRLGLDKFLNVETPAEEKTQTE